jgi:hypothetical protein
VKFYKFQEVDGKWFVTLTDSPEHWAMVAPPQELTIDDPLLTVEELVSQWEQLLEGENFHSMMDIPQNLVNVLRFIDVPDAQVKAALWEILTTQGGWM